MIIVVNYGVGNLASIVNMLDFVGIEAKPSTDASEIRDANRLILPGVGAFDKAMRALTDSHLIPSLEDAVHNRKTPVLGICLGMHLLGAGSAEGSLAGLGWLKARSEHLADLGREGMKIPNNGWHFVTPKGDCPLFSANSQEFRYYFNHSYHMICKDPKIVAGSISYGSTITCAVQKDNVLGVQFHPEKSHRFGMDLLHRFATKEIKAV